MTSCPQQNEQIHKFTFLASSIRLCKAIGRSFDFNFSDVFRSRRLGIAEKTISHIAAPSTKCKSNLVISSMNNVPVLHVGNINIFFFQKNIDCFAPFFIIVFAPLESYVICLYLALFGLRCLFFSIFHL